MGLFDFLTAEGRFKNHVRRVANRDAQPEDREASVRWLSKDGSAKALVALLSRFDINITSHLKDVAERDFTYQVLLNHRADLAEPLRHWLRQCKQFPRPLKLLEETEGEQAAIAMVFELLAVEAQRSALYPEKKRDLLVWLAERRHPGAFDAALPFLADFDENVRYAAIEVMLHQQDERARLPLLQALARPEEDSNRVRHQICEAAHQRRWSVADVDLTGRLPAGFAVEDGRILPA